MECCCPSVFPYVPFMAMSRREDIETSYMVKILPSVCVTDCHFLVEGSKVKVTRVGR